MRLIPFLQRGTDGAGRACLTEARPPAQTASAPADAQEMAGPRDGPTAHPLGRGTGPQSTHPESGLPGCPARGGRGLTQQQQLQLPSVPLLLLQEDLVDFLVDRSPTSPAAAGWGAGPSGTQGESSLYYLNLNLIAF